MPSPFWEPIRDATDLRRRHPLRRPLRPQNTSFDDYRDLWLRCEELGYDWVSDFDHFLPIFGDPTGPQFEGLTLLSAMAAHTSRVRCGMLVLGVTYRHPAVVAKMAATIDHVSGGRLELGMGAAWYELEHDAVRHPVPAHRRAHGHARRGLPDHAQPLDAGDDDLRGQALPAEGRALEPKPVQEHLPLVIGGAGERRTLRIVAEHGDIWNTFYGDVDTTGTCSTCSPGTARTWAATRRRPQVADLPRRAAPTRSRRRESGCVRSTAARCRAAPAMMVVGTPEQCVEQLRPYADLGVGDFLLGAMRRSTSRRSSSSRRRWRRR